MCPTLLQMADVFALPSLWEGLPIALLEAMGAGLPVIATRVEGVEEMIVDGENGLLVQPADGESLKTGLLRMLAQPDLRVNLGTAGRALVESSFSLDQMGRTIRRSVPEIAREKTVKQTRPVIILLVRLLLSAGAVYFLWKACVEFYNLAWGAGTWLGGFSPKLGPAFFFFILICLIILAGFLLALWRPAQAHAWLLRLTPLRERLGWARWLLVGLILIVPVKLLQYSYWGGVFTGVSMRLLLLAVMAIAIAALITKGQENTIKLPNVSVALLLIAAALYLGDAFHWVRDYPFSFSWSEGNRIWDYSALFGQRLYNFPQDQSIYAFIDRGRQFLWGLPFLLPGITLRGMRLWDGLVTTIPYAILGWVAFQRFKGHTALWFLAGVWAFVFLTQGPIYTPLVISAILVAIAWRRPLWIALPLIGLAGYYAQLARYTWMFAPALWAGMLYLADTPTEGQKITKRQWISATLVVAGRSDRRHRHPAA